MVSVFSVVLNNSNEIDVALNTKKMQYIFNKIYCKICITPKSILLRLLPKLFL